MKITAKAFLFAGIMGICMISCKSKQSGQLPIQSIPVVEVLQQDVPLYDEFVGQTFGKADIAIRARVEGFLEGMHFEEGSWVKRGTLLYTIDSSPFRAKVAEAESGLAQAKTTHVKTQSDLSRIRPLAEINAVSKSDLDAAVAQEGAASAAVEAAKATVEFAEIQLGYCKIYSPIDGLIGRTEAKPGDFVGREPNPVVLNMVSNTSTILVRFSITESDYLRFMRMREDKLRDKLPEEIRGINLILADGSIHNYKGQLDFANRAVDPTTGTIMLQASFPNPNNLLRPGQFAKPRAVVDYIEAALLVPQRSVMELQGKHFVYILNPDNTVKQQEVSLGETWNNLWLVEEGLNPGDRVVYEGLQKVRTGTSIKPELQVIEVIKEDI